MSRKVTRESDAKPATGAPEPTPTEQPIVPVASADNRSEAERLLARLTRERPDKVLALNLRVETLRMIEKEHPKLMKAMFDFAKGKFPADVPAQALKAQSDMLRSLLDVLTVKVRENEQSGGQQEATSGPSHTTIVFKGVAAPKRVAANEIEIEAG